MAFALTRGAVALIRTRAARLAVAAVTRVTTTMVAGHPFTSPAVRSHKISTHEFGVSGVDAGPDRVIPERILVFRSLNRELRDLLWIGLLPSFIRGGVQVGLNRQARLSARVPNELHDHFLAREGAAAPIQADRGEHPMLDL